MTKQEILETAALIEYGKPEDNFSTIADLWSTYLWHTQELPEGIDLSASDVAVMMMLFKIGRLATGTSSAERVRVMEVNVVKLVVNVFYCLSLVLCLCNLKNAILQIKGGKCKNCVHFEFCEEFTEPDEDYAEVGGCCLYKHKFVYILEKIFWWFWCFPQMLLGLIVKIVTRARRIRGLHNQICYHYDVQFGSLSLGEYTFICPSHYDNIDVYFHEGGHTLQSRILGWLWLPVIGIPSFLWACWYSIAKPKVSYYSFYTEKWADKLGEVRRD